MAFNIQKIASLIGGKNILRQPDMMIHYLLIDSRRLTFPASTLFFAIKTDTRDGNDYILDLYEKGNRNFIISEEIDYSLYPKANFILCTDTTTALQTIVTAHRLEYSYPVIGITGSNGKTIVKEWLNKLLYPDYNILRSPRSYNSQIGVPLSVWEMSDDYNLAIFEAGISEPGEMIHLQKIIEPNIGILTNIGSAHDEGFVNREEKTKEKVILFKDCPILFLNKDDLATYNIAAKELPNTQLLTWGKSVDADLQITKIETVHTHTHLTAIYQKQPIAIEIPFSDEASIDNIITCWRVLLHLNIPNKIIAERVKTLTAVDMRLQIVSAMNHCTLINDSYSFDVNSLSIALDFLAQQKIKQTVIISDLAYFDLHNYEAIAHLLVQKNIQRVIAIGKEWERHAYLLNAHIKEVEFFPSPEIFIQAFSSIKFQKEAILLKGARLFHFERFVPLLEEKIHQTRLEINVSALAHNLKQYRKYIKPTTKLMAMVKASGYGSGSVEVAALGQFYHVDYLTVAYADEGVQLRNAGISIPIVIMNVDEVSFDTLIAHHLEPNIFSFKIHQAFDTFLQRQGIAHYPIHFKIDTGMHRLGFEEEDLPEITKRLISNNRMVVQSAFTHFVASEDPNEDAFTRHQAELFTRLSDYVEKQLGYKFIRHICNSSGIIRFPEYQMDMVRLGIGLYGIDSSGLRQQDLETVSTLITTIAQIHHVKAGDTVGYNRKGKITRDSRIATIRIGYADGFNRKLGYGNGKVFINGHLAPVVGTICMDMAMVDITDIPNVHEGDSVEIFGKNIPVQQVADWVGTIPYEILTCIGERIPRIYVEE